MTQNEIIELAKKAGMMPDGEMWFSPSYENCDVDQANLETFANLIAEKEREKILAVLRRKPDQQIYKVLDEIRGMK